ncbi:hypothetical protein AB0D46_16180 [Streptomyces sp. NPDC048383]|uniref:hypothetical protein n=1 Tax=Streptomyces sp. NPDC048383 TaxID=3155386 RepID=UPI0034171D59
MAILGAVALALAAGWVWSASRPIPITPPRQVEPLPAPPAKLPWKRPFRDFLPLLLAVVVVLPAVAVLTELITRPDGDDLKRIAAIQKAGAEVTRGTIVEVHRVKSGKNKEVADTADVTVEVPVHAPGGGSTDTRRLEVVSGHISDRFGGRFAGESVLVLHAPTAPALGGVVDDPGHIERYVEAASPLAFSLTPLTTWIGLGIGAVLTFFGSLMFVRVPPSDPARRTLREDAAAGALPAVRARIVAAQRNEHTTFGTVDGTVRVRSDHKLRFALEDGSEVLIGNPTVEPAGLALLAARMGERPGWLCGARNWRLIRYDEQPVAFVTDEGEVAWLKMDREEFRRVLEPATPVQPDPERSTRLSPWPTTVVPGAHWPWLGGMALSYALVVLVLMLPMSWLAASLTTSLAAAVAVAACVFLLRRRADLSNRTGRWEVRATRDPELGPA